MKSIFFKLSFITLIFLALMTACKEDDSKQILGEWYYEDYDTLITLTFNKDGSCQHLQKWHLLDPTWSDTYYYGKWSLSKDVLIILWNTSNMANRTYSIVQLDSNYMVLMDDDGIVETYIR